MLSLAVTALMAVAGQAIEIERNNKTLELNLQVVEAFERGPVIFDASITNRGAKPLFIKDLTNFGNCWISEPVEWQMQLRRPLSCRTGGSDWLLKPGETFTERQILHQDFRSAFPAGNYQVAVTWSLRAVQKRRIRDREFVDIPGQLSAFPTKTFPVTITAATEGNLKALVKRLETEFAALPALLQGDKKDGSAFQVLCNKVIFAQHRELSPLALRLLDRCPSKSELWEATYRIPGLLVETIFDADTATAHHLFVDRLLATPVPEHSFLAFPVWCKPAQDLGNLVDWVFIRDANVFEFLVHKPSLWLFGLSNLLDWFHESSPRMLPDSELQRLANAKDPRVRAATASWFRDRLGR